MEKLQTSYIVIVAEPQLSQEDSLRKLGSGLHMEDMLVEVDILVVDKIREDFHAIRLLTF